MWRHYGDCATPFGGGRNSTPLITPPHPGSWRRRRIERWADHDAANLELNSAAAVFALLGAAGDSQRVEMLRSGRLLPGSLTGREVEVLSCVAAGQSNREVAATLFIAEKTVARHLSNIFTKLNVSSRTEAAAFAYAHGLVSHRRA